MYQHKNMDKTVTEPKVQVRQESLAYLVAFCELQIFIMQSREINLILKTVDLAAHRWYPEPASSAGIHHALTNS